MEQQNIYEPEMYSNIDPHQQVLTHEDPSPILKYIVATLSVIIILSSILTFIGDIISIWSIVNSGLDAQAGFPVVGMFLVPVLTVSAILGFIGSCIVTDLHEKFVYMRMYIIGSGVYVVFSLVLQIIRSLFTLQHPLLNKLSIIVGTLIGATCLLLCCGTCIGISIFYAFSLNKVLPHENKTIIEKIKDTTKKEKALAIVLGLIIATIVLVFFISFIAALVGVFNPKYIYIQNYNTNDCSGGLATGSGRAPVNVCREVPSGSELITYSNSGGKRVVKIQAFLDKTCKTEFFAIDLEENKCFQSQGKSLYVSLF